MDKKNSIKHKIITPIFINEKIMLAIINRISKEIITFARTPL